MTDPRNHIDKYDFPLIETLRVKAPTTFMRAGPRPSAGASTELIFGELFHVHDIGRGWVWGQSECLLPGSSYPGYVGWVKRSDLAELTSHPNYKTTAVSAPVFSNADIKSPLKFTLPLGAVFHGIDQAAFLETETGFIHKQHAGRLADPSVHLDWVSIAESLLGQPYIWGGVSSFGLDCSGLVQTALRNFGQDAPRDSGQQAQLGTKVRITNDLSGLKRGDLVFWKGHVGIMTSPTRLLHANAHHMMVASEPLQTAVSRVKKSAGTVTAIRR